MNKFKFLHDIAEAIRDDNEVLFMTWSGLGVEVFGLETLTEMLNTELPMLLESSYIVRLHEFTAQDSYEDQVFNILTNTTRFFIENGFELGKDFSFALKDVPCLCMYYPTADQIKLLYPPVAWKSLLPYLSIQGIFD